MVGIVNVFYSSNCANICHFTITTSNVFIVFVISLNVLRLNVYYSPNNTNGPIICDPVTVTSPSISTAFYKGAKNTTHGWHAYDKCDS